MAALNSLTDADYLSTDLEPDLRTPNGRAAAARSIHACLTYLLTEVERVADDPLCDALTQAIRAAEDSIARIPDYRN